ncbi:MAG: AAA family ATPase [Steroidobacteraceae bacterium]
MPMPDPAPQTVETPDDDRALAAALASPRAWPHAVDAPVRVVETHISRVYLTGPYAYKVKKPLRLPFLDYGTPERRRAYCEEELRLNRRTAPDLYLGVSAIAGTPGAPRVDGDGPAFEHAVRMRQFDPGDALDALVDTGRVATAEIAVLARDIERFHAAAARCPDGAPYGTPDEAGRIAADNLADLAAAGVAATTTLASLHAGLDVEFARIRALLGTRRAAGRVRECHGDLHCGNVVRWQGRLVAFDGIEFDPALRWIDVANDVAFLSMDLAERGRADLRRVLLQAWFDAGGDASAFDLLRYFEAGRALVRAKVAGLRARQPGGGAVHRSASECYVHWALSRLQRSRPPLLVTCGYSGSGKTWLAGRLAAALDALHLRSDVERKRLAGLGPLDDSRSPQDGGIYTVEFNNRTYERLGACATSALSGGMPVVVDAACLRRDERRALLAIADAIGAPAALLHCVAPEGVLRGRIAARAREGADASEAGLATLARQPGYWEPFDPGEAGRVVVVDTTGPDPSGDALTALAGAGIA